jgi:ferredoxin-NADP reductase/ferredoxin
MARIGFDGDVVEADAGESVLDALLRQGHDIPYSCRKGTCLSCIIVAENGEPPASATEGLKPTQVDRGWFLACQCPADQDFTVSLPDDAEIFGRGVIAEKVLLAPDVLGLKIRPANDLYYHAGQFLNLRRSDGLQRSYSLASVPSLDDDLEFHVKRLRGGEMSGWLFDETNVGDEISFQGPAGDCYYLPGRTDQDLMMIGTGTGLAPLLGIARDALAAGHRGGINLYHGSREEGGLYAGEALRELSDAFPNFSYHPCVSGEGAASAYRAGRADVLAFEDQSDLSGSGVYLCGYPPMVASAKKSAYIRGAAMADIHADPFDLKDLRKAPRTEEPERPDVW